MIGKLPENILDAVLETIPVELSILSADDKVLGWNKHNTRLFFRPEGALGRDVHDCHPFKSIDKVDQILAEMKAGTRDKATFWIDFRAQPEMPVRKVLIEFFALRDADGAYLGCMEVGQDITEHQTITGEKRLRYDK